MPLDVVVEFKRGVYEMALTELARFLPRHESRNRFLRGGSPRHGEAGHNAKASGHPSSMALPPGGSFEPNPNTSSHPYTDPDTL